MQNPNHRQEWLDSAVCEQIIEANVWSITDPLEVDKLLNIHAQQRWKHSDHLVPGWAVAGVDPLTGEQWLLGAQYKPDTPLVTHDGKAKKYLSAKGYETSPLFLDMGGEYWQQVQKAALTQPILITEGAKKAGAILSQGIAAISLPGVWNGQKKGALDAKLKPYCGLRRTVYLCFDNDLLTKEPVQAALDRLGKLISNQGAVVKVIKIPEGKLKGIDDYLASFPPDERKTQLKTLMSEALEFELWREPYQQKQESRFTSRCSLAQRYLQAKDYLGERLRLNELTTELELDGKPFDLDELQITMALQWDLHIPDNQVVKILGSIGRDNAYSPVVNYLDQVWAEYHQVVGPDYLNDLATRFLGAEKPLHNNYVRKTLIGAVARAYNPGCKHDTALILQGPQGIGKSEFFKRLAGSQWFDDSLGNLSDKDERLKLHKVWFVEWAELESVFRRKDLASVKSFLTSTSDLIRPPYGRAVQRFNRASVIVGSTNQDEFLADTTGNRRFLIVPCHQRVNTDLLTSERDLIWCAAVAAYRLGETSELSQQDKEESNAENQEYAIRDPWEDVILAYAGEREWVTTSEILDNAIRLDLERRTRGDEMRISGILKSAGWQAQQLRTDGKKRRIWKKKFAN